VAPHRLCHSKKVHDKIETKTRLMSQMMKKLKAFFRPLIFALARNYWKEKSIFFFLKHVFGILRRAIIIHRYFIFNYTWINRKWAKCFMKRIWTIGSIFYKSCRLTEKIELSVVAGHMQTRRWIIEKERVRRAYGLKIDQTVSSKTVRRNLTLTIKRTPQYLK
jgi:hypothetical protein